MIRKKNDESIKRTDRNVVPKQKTFKMIKINPLTDILTKFCTSGSVQLIVCFLKKHNIIFNKFILLFYYFLNLTLSYLTSFNSRFLLTKQSRCNDKASV